MYREKEEILFETTERHELPSTLKELQQFVTKLTTALPDNIKPSQVSVEFDTHTKYYPYDPDPIILPSLKIYYKRPLTEQEKQEIFDKENQRTAELQARELEELTRLQAKYPERFKE